MYRFLQPTRQQFNPVYTGLALCLVSALLGGCSGGGGGGSTGPNPFVPSTDLHADIPFEGTRVFPDNGFFSGAINTGGDIDYFQFNVTAGVTYTIQVEVDGGRFLEPPSADDMNENRDLIIFIHDLNGLVLPTSRNSEGAETFDIGVAGFGDSGDDSGWRGDSRITFVALATERVYMNVTHFRQLVGTGNYVLSVASSHLGYNVSPTVESELPIPGEHQGGRRIIAVTDADPPELLFNDLVRGSVGPMGISIATQEFFFDFLLAPRPIFGDDDEPQTPAVHIHNGYPSDAPHLPLNSINESGGGGDDPHPFAADLSEIFARSISRGSTEDFEFDFTFPDGQILTIPAEVTLLEADEASGERYLVNLKYGQAENRGLGADLTEDVGHLFVAYNWYIDIHITDDLDVVPGQYAVSYPFGDIYGVFETEFFASPEFLTRASDDVGRGFLANDEMSIFLDSSLMVLQILNEEKELKRNFNLTPDTFDDFYESVDVEVPNPYEGYRIDAHKGGIGQTGTFLFEAGIIPMREASREYVPGIRTPLSPRLTTPEMQMLRQAYYSGGWYMDISPPGDDTPVARLEGSFWEIQNNPNDQYPAPVRNNSPAYEFGHANFVSDYTDGGDITIIANGKIIGVLDQVVTDETIPACGEESISGLVASERFIPQSYPYRAFAEDGTEWSGTFTVEDYGCNTVVLSASTAE